MEGGWAAFLYQEYFMLSKVNFLFITIFVVMGSGCSSSTQPTVNAVVEIISTPTLLPTAPVVLPTLSDAEIKVNALNLLENNGDCRLPCIWGLTPGITTTAERRKILASYGKISDPDFSLSGSEASENPGGFGIAVTRNKLRIVMGLNYYETDNLIEILSLVAFPPLLDDKLIFGDDDYLELTKYYSLPQLLSNYGLPSEVLVIAFPYDPFLKADYEPFSLVVVYSDLGIMAEYISPSQREGDIARGCPGQGYLTLRTWDVKNNIPIKKIASIASGEGMSETAYDYFVPIQNAASMSVEDFYNTFKEPNNNQCLEVLSNLWTP
jgi:hypothetical protein